MRRNLYFAIALLGMAVLSGCAAEAENNKKEENITMSQEMITNQPEATVAPEPAATAVPTQEEEYAALFKGIEKAKSGKAWEITNRL